MEETIWRLFRAPSLQATADVESFFESVREHHFVRVRLIEPKLSKELMGSFYDLLLGPDLALTHLELKTDFALEDQSFALTSAISQASTLRVLKLKLTVDETSTGEKAGFVAAQLLGALTECPKLEELSLHIDTVYCPGDLSEEVERFAFDEFDLRFPCLKRLSLEAGMRVGLVGLSPQYLFNQSPSLEQVKYHGERFDRTPAKEASVAHQTKAAKRL